MKTTKRALFSSLLALVLCFAMLLGTTYAWFTDSVTSAGNKIVAGTLDVEMYWADGAEEVPAADSADWTDASTGPIFNYAYWEPGYAVARHVRIANEGSLALKYQIKIAADGEVSKLAEVIDVYYVDPATQIEGRDDLTASIRLGTLKQALEGLNATAAGNLEAGKAHTVTLVLKMQEGAGNEYQGLEIGSSFSIILVATQATVENDSFGNDYDKDAKYPEADAWEGTSDISWYEGNESETEFVLDTAEQFAGLSELVNDGNSFAGKTITLTGDIDLYCEDTSANADGDPVTFRPIGDHSKGGVFEGVFDGNGHTIYNLYQNGWDLGYEWGIYGSYGLFGNLNNATVKNLTLSGGESYIEGGDVSFVAGSATGTCVFENITIKDSIAATYNNGCGGIIGWSGSGNYTFKNITIAEDAVLGGLWGSFDSSIGGIVGQAEPGATYNFENVTVACRIDAYNDCTASYDYYNYRMCGMLIGRLEETTTIDGANYPDTSKYDINCTNVEVIYGDWANYHYCRATGARAIRVEAGYAYGGIAADYDHSVCTAHHMELIAFDQIFGGDQYAVKGLKTYDGVNVVYNNK